MFWSFCVSARMQNSKNTVVLHCVEDIRCAGPGFDSIQRQNNNSANDPRES